MRDLTITNVQDIKPKNVVKRFIALVRMVRMVWLFVADLAAIAAVFSTMQRHCNYT